MASYFLTIPCFFATAVFLMFCAGWVHRDISTGNLLCYSGRGILADFEYAKKFDPKPTVEASPEKTVS